MLFARLDINAQGNIRGEDKNLPAAMKTLVPTADSKLRAYKEARWVLGADYVFSVPLLAGQRIFTEVSRAATQKRCDLSCGLVMGFLNSDPRHCLARITVLLLSWLLVVSPVTAMDKSHRVKAALIYQFAKYTHWPKAMGDTITFCTYGGDTLAGALHTVQNKRVRNMRVDVRHVSSLPEVLRYCQVLFIGAQQSSLPTLLGGLENSAILTVGESKNFTTKI